MKVLVLTQSGAVYILDKEAMTWERTGVSGYELRSRSGTLLEWPTIKIGSCLELWCPAFVEGAMGRIIMSTPVVNVREYDGTTGSESENQGSSKPN